MSSNPNIGTKFETTTKITKDMGSGNLKIKQSSPCIFVFLVVNGFEEGPQAIDQIVSTRNFNLPIIVGRRRLFKIAQLLL
jgi:hypothetical protein